MGEQADKLIEELKVINKKAFEMALSVQRDPALRGPLAEEARLLKSRLLRIAQELERIEPAARKQWFHPISESFLDLDFVVADMEITSLRLADIIRWAD